MASPTVEDVRSIFESDVPDDVIEQLIAAEAEEVSSRFGEETADTQESFPTGSFITLDRKASSITSVTEIFGVTETVLAANDYRIRRGGWQLERLTTGTHPQSIFAPRVLISYAIAESNRRWRVILDLVKLSLQNDGLKSESTGDNSVVHVDYQEEREKILSTLNNSVMPL